MTRPTRLPRLILSALLLLLVVPAGASAAVVQSTGFSVSVLADGEEVNHVFLNSVEGDPGATDSTIAVADTATPLTIGTDPGDDCTQANPNLVVCEADYFTWFVDLSDEKDEFTATGTIGGEAHGGAGDDKVRGGAGDEVLFGGDGTDELAGNGGSDYLSGTEGPDTVSGGAGDDVFLDYIGDGSDEYDGGPDIDRIGYPVDEPGEQVTLDLAAGSGGRTAPESEPDVLADIEDAEAGGRVGIVALGLPPTGPGDVLLGSGISNFLDGGDGNDSLDGRGGADRLEGGRGDDQIQARDGAADRVLCGAGLDTALLDQFDVAADCENAPVEFRRAEGADVQAPGCVVRKVKRRYGLGAFLKGITARVRCDEAATLSAQLVATLPSGRLRGARVGDLVLAQRSARSRGGSAATRIKVKPAKRYVRKLANRKVLKVRLVVEASDQYGNRGRSVKRAKITKPKRKGKGKRGSRRR